MVVGLGATLEALYEESGVGAALKDEETGASDSTPVQWRRIQEHVKNEILTMV